MVVIALLVDVKIVHQRIVLGPSLFVLYIRDLFEVFENKMVNYTADSILLAVVNYPIDRFSLTEILNIYVK
mgnify:CR=1 FL=1